MSNGHVRIRGIDEVNRLLGELMPKEARLLTRQTTTDVAKEIAARAKDLMPVDTGRMERGTYGKPERDKNGSGAATVRVKGAFYWKFLERGDGPDGIEHAFFLRAKEAVLKDIDSLVVAKFTRQLAERLKKVAGR